MILETQSSKWAEVFKSANAMQTELIKNEIESQDIECILMNNQDSVYPVFGQVKLLVPVDKAEISKAIIENFLNKDDEETN